jgi:hypothetical protein
MNMGIKATTLITLIVGLAQYGSAVTHSPQSSEFLVFPSTEPSRVFFFVLTMRPCHRRTFSPRKALDGKYHVAQSANNGIRCPW